MYSYRFLIGSVLLVDRNVIDILKRFSPVFRHQKFYRNQLHCGCVVTVVHESVKTGQSMSSYDHQRVKHFHAISKSRPKLFLWISPKYVTRSPPIPPLCRSVSQPPGLDTRTFGIIWLIHFCALLFVFFSMSSKEFCRCFSKVHCP